MDEKYCQSFIDSSIGVNELAKLSPDDLRKLIPDVIQRSKLLRYICSELRDPLKAIESLIKAPPRANSYHRDSRRGAFMFPEYARIRCLPQGLLLRHRWPLMSHVNHAIAGQLTI
eukprot:TRINITY_DN3394_c0_g1_i1.p1 TRINITY_DN3394_c0_g1~~TRINITY_DN3394_c0_g1_i1.p1  ORF type:complete len:128 (-),score=8.13 TRINITY_DN3394_c0_g1_i1:357-701(-)